MVTMMAALAPLKSLLRGKPVRALKILLGGAYKGVLTRSQCFYIVGHDDANGELIFNGKRVLLQWPGVERQPIFNRAKNVLKKLFDKVGADYMQNPVRDTILGGKLITVHPLGGCCMGDDAASGVVDHCKAVCLILLRGRTANCMKDCTFSMGQSSPQVLGQTRS